MALTFSFSSKNNEHFATPLDGGAKFLVGKRTLYQGNSGLYNVNITPGIVYDPAGFESAFGFWAWFLYPTSRCESKGSFYCLNTYDRAKFTFGFMQYAAHVPEGDFVVFLRKLLALPGASWYFPRLRLEGNRICYRRDNGILIPLENASSTQGLMDYFNPSLNEIEQQELICSARMVHWAMNDPDHIRVQVETAIDHFRKNMISYAERYELDNVPDKVCLVICDIRHQGRASSSDILAALQTGGNYEKAYANLAGLGAVHYPDRIKTLKNAISDLVSRGILGKKKYSVDAGDFVDMG
jgi:hypothetical protein